MEHDFPNEVMYLKTHEWIRIQDNIAIIGITDFAQHQLGDIVYVELPEIGTAFDKGKNVAEIESVKAVSELIMPLSGKIIEVNKEVMSKPQLLNYDCYDKGWITIIEPATYSWKSIHNLITGSEYIKFLHEKRENPLRVLN